jgi:uncharacterized protein with NRDE domain
MCLIAIAWRIVPESPLIFIGNRDEFHQRPAAPATWWDSPPGILAGRDLKAGGTWLGLNRQGHFAVVTNFREGGNEPATRSRGELVTRFLEGMDGDAHWSLLHDQAQDYAGYNLVFYDGDTLGYFSNRGMHRRSLEPGLYALSNHFLDTPWPKVTRLKQALNAQLKLRWDSEAMLELMGHRKPASDEDLPDTGIGKHWERILSPAFIVSEEYGTRCTSLIRQNSEGRFSFTERSFAPSGDPGVTREYEFQPQQRAPRKR